MFETGYTVYESDMLHLTWFTLTHPCMQAQNHTQRGEMKAVREREMEILTVWRDSERTKEEEEQ